MSAMHFKVSYGTTACSWYVGWMHMTTDHAQVTCGTCKRTKAFRGAS